ncbi:MAG: DHH family phosphoesterase [Desulfobacterales bacterium]|nr:DHH family phosphoesterase [Desulfobacterales bacterium]
MALSVSEKLRRFYDLFSSDDRILIVINADPDAIASAIAVKRLLWRRVANITISNINIIKRPDNLAMIRLLDISLVHVDEIDRESFNRFIMVDSQPDHNEVFARFNFDVIIDHHPETDVKGSFIDIRPKYGATATIMTEYLRAAKIKPTAKLATGLFYAIKTDTSNFERQTLIEDIRAFQFLFRYVNIYMARKIEQSDLKLEFLKYFRTAIQNMCRRKNKIYAHLGSVVNPDICVLIADFFMRIDSINWSIVSGIYERKLIIIFRNDGLRRNAGNVAKLSFGRIGSAGGHKSMARSEIAIADIKDLVDCKDDDKILTWVINKIKKRAGER